MIDVTFVSAAHGWALTNGALYETTDGGHRWRRANLPTPAIKHVRFAESTAGYAWDANGRLWLTRDDTNSWQRAGLSQVDSVEGNRAGVWALAGSLPGANVWHAAVASTSWSELGLTPNRGGELFPHGEVAYVLGEQGAGPVTPSYDVYVGGRKSGNHPLPCEHPPRPVPQSPMTVSTDGTLFLVCDVEPQTAHAQQLAYVSSDHGATWSTASAPPVPVDGVAAVREARFSWANDVWAYRGGKWKLSLHGPTVPPGFDLAGFAVFGFEDDSHGVALTRTGQLYLTKDVGKTWRMAPLPTRVPAADCRSRELVVQAGRQGGGSGNAHADVQITNVGKHTCALPSPSALAIVASHGQPLPVEMLSLDTAAGATAVSLPPGAKVALSLSWQNWCGVRTGPLNIAVTIGKSGTVSGSFDGPPDYNYWPRCVAQSKLSMMQVLGPYTRP